jgi:hypothetical protein
MRRQLVGWGIALAVVSSVGSTVSFAGPDGYAGESRTVESVVREVNKVRRTVYLTNGALLSTNDTKRLEQLAPGMRVRAAVEERGNGEKFINRLEIVP